MSVESFERDTPAAGNRRAFQIGDRVVVDGVRGTLTGRYGDDWLMMTVKPQRIDSRVYDVAFVVREEELCHEEQTS